MKSANLLLAAPALLLAGCTTADLPRSASALDIPAAPERVQID